MNRHVVSLHTRVWNPGGAHRALLLHGLGSDGATMWRLADHLAGRDYEVVAPDLRGQGISPPATSYTLDEMAADVRALGGGWDLVVGHSLGGAIAAVLLADADLARGGVLLDPVLLVAPAQRAELESIADEAGGAVTFERIRAEAPSWSTEDAFRLARASAMLSPHVVHRIVADNPQWDLLPHVAAWTVPVTILAADPAMAPMFTPEHAAAVVAACATARIITVPQAGHSVHRDAPDTVLSAIDHADSELRSF
jgi:pimeloyl-ACP methyl ester carboxylesterase